MLMDFLKSLPNDATYNQGASVKRCFQKAKEANESYGYDLSAATDRLPILLQISIISSLISKEVGEAWGEVLVGRDYVLNSKEYGKHTLRYQVGQPMGALSS